MLTISLKLSEDDALHLRSSARKAKMTVSSFLRQRIRTHDKAEHARVIRTPCPLTGATIFTSKGGHPPPLTTASVREMLTEFP